MSAVTFLCIERKMGHYVICLIINAALSYIRIEPVAVIQYAYMTNALSCFSFANTVIGHGVAFLLSALCCILQYGHLNETNYKTKRMYIFFTIKLN